LISDEENYVLGIYLGPGRQWYTLKTFQHINYKTENHQEQQYSSLTYPLTFSHATHAIKNPPSRHTPQLSMQTTNVCILQLL